jgi:ribonuclease D
MSTAHAVYLFQLQQRDFSGALGGILGSAKSVKTGVSLRDDIRQLKQLFPFEEKNMVDIGAVAQRHGIKQSGLRNLTGLFLGFRISKGAQTSNWAMPRLTPKQITYAATDAWVCRELYLKFEQAGILDARDDHSNLSSGVSA